MTTDINTIRKSLKGFAQIEFPYDIKKNTPVKYLTIKENTEFFYEGGKFVRFGNDTLVLCNGSNEWSVKKYIKDKGGNILYSSKFFIPNKEEDYDCIKEVMELKSIIKTQQQIINKLSYQVKKLSS